MLGQLPTSLDVCGTAYKIRTDYRNILQIFSAYNDSNLSDSEKVYVRPAFAPTLQNSL